MAMRDVFKTLEYDKLKDIIGKFIQTTYGKKALSNLKPVFDIQKAQYEFEMLKEFFDYFYRWGTIPLDDIYISQLIKDSFAGRLTEKELFLIGNFLGMIKEIEKEFKEHDSDICEKYIVFDFPQELFDEIIKAIDDHGFVKDTATSYLFEIRTQIKQLKEEISRTLKNLMHSRMREVIADTAIFLKRSRYTILTKANFKEYINGRIIDISKSGGFFVEPDAIYPKNNELEELILKEEAEKRRILTALTELIRKHSSRLMHNEKRIGFLDLQIAKFEYSKDFEQPDIVFSNKPILYAKNIKHPILAHIKQDTKSVDIELKKDSKLIITGPNTGGKTVFLKTVGLCVLCAFSNIPLIASKVEIGKFSSVFAIIGDEQNILESLSSFSAKMIAVKNIFNSLEKNSLVLLDEIGSGTSPDEGEAVAYSIIKNLTDRCVFVVTTHYKKLAHILASKQYPTAAFEFDKETLKPTYRLKYSQIGQSYAREILQTLNMPKKIIEDADEFYKNNETQFSKLETELENELVRLQNKSEELDKLKIQYENLTKQIEQEKSIIIENLKQQEEIKKRQYEEIIDELKLELSNLLKEKNVSQAHKKLNKIKQKAQDIFNKTETKANLQETFNVSDRVIFNSMEGTILKIKGKKATIEINGKVFEAQLSSLKKAKQEKKQEKKILVQSQNKFSSIELNIIGKRRDEAELELMRFIDSLITDSIKTARIIHGIGSGILRSMVHETLKNHPYVKSFHTAHPNEGGDGATIVELK